MEVLRRRASEMGSKAVPVQVDINDERPLTDLVADYDIVVNAAGPEWETLVPGLRAAVAAGIHCCDLGADGRTAEQQLALDSTAKAQGVLALIGMGLDPGLDNLLAVHASQQFDQALDLQCCFQSGAPR